MKKLLAMLLSLLMVVAPVSAAFADGEDFTLLIAGGDVGEHLITEDNKNLLAVDVNLNGTVEDTLLTLTFDLTYEAAQLTFVRMDAGEAFNSSMLNDTVPGILRFSFTSEGVAVSETIKVATLYFELANDMEAGTEIAFALSEGADAETFVDNAAVVTHHSVAQSFAPFILSELETMPVIVEQPSNETIQVGTNVKFKVVATGGGLQYQWEYSKDNGASWVTWSGKTKDTLSVKASESNNGCLYRCVVSNSCGSVTTKKARLTVDGVKPNILVHPVSVEVALGDSVTFKVVAAGVGLKYQWQYSKNNGATWYNWSGKTKTQATVAASTTNNGCLYRCVVSNDYGSVTSKNASLTQIDNRPSILTHPKSATVTVGTSVTFKVVADGEGTITYQWEYSKTNGTSWVTWSGKTKATLTLKASETNNGCMYRCVVSNEYGSVTTKNARLTVSDLKPTILTQPKNATVALGESAVFKVAAGGSDLTYQWEYSKNNGATWTVWSGRTRTNLSVVASATNNGCMYRCVITNANGTVTSKSVRLTVSDAKPVILTNPKNVSAAVGNDVTFTVVAWGEGLTYQWQYSSNGSTWTNCKSGGYNTATFTFKAASNLNGRQYRCVVSNEFGSVNSSAGTFTVK